MTFFANAPVKVRADIAASHEMVWVNLGKARAFWTGPERTAIIAEMRTAVDCKLCAQRKQALSPNMVQGKHDTAGNILSDAVIEAVHRITTDPGRLTKTWLNKLFDQGLKEGSYIELVGIIIQAILIDTFDRALGLKPRDLPKAHAGVPSGFVVEGLEEEGAWVKTVPTQLGLKTLGPEVYFRVTLATDVFVPLVNRALSQAPEEIRGLGKLASTDYIPLPDVGNIPAYAKYGRAINPVQIELTSSRISALNGCFY